MEKSNKEKMRDQVFGVYDGEYIGNIWGWKISFIGLGVMILLWSLVGYQHYKNPQKDKTFMEQIVLDSTATQK